MAANIARWWKYAQAKLDRAVASGNEELDELEARQRAEVADKPWLASDADAPTFEEARARIEWEAEEQRRRSEAEAPAAPGPTPAPVAPSAGDAPAGPATPAAPAAPAAEDPAIAAAKLELERQQREGAARLDAIRQELGVDAPPKSDA